jgi:multidrug resistance efflux pump
MAMMSKGTYGVLAVVILLTAAAALIANRPMAISNARLSQQTDGPLIARGFVDAPADSVMIATNPNGGPVIKELLIRRGQRVQRGDIVAVLVQAPGIAAHVEIARNNLRKQEMYAERTLKGTQMANLQLQEDELRSAIENDRLVTILRSRSGRPAQEQKLEVWLAEANLTNQRMSVEFNKRKAAVDLQLRELDIQKHKIAVEEATILRDEGVVRSPISGVVTEIFARTGEMVLESGVAKVVDMTQLRVFATVDEIHLHRLKLGSPVEITFRGSTSAYRGKIAHSPLMVKREKRSEADLGVASVRLVEVEIEPDDGVPFPEMIGREARVTFQ